MISDLVKFKLVSHEPDLYGIWGDQDEIQFSVGDVEMCIAGSEPGGDSVPSRLIEARTERNMSEDAIESITNWASQTDTQDPVAVVFSDLDEKVSSSTDPIFEELEYTIRRVATWITWRHNLVPDNSDWPRAFDGQPAVVGSCSFLKLPGATDWCHAPSRTGPIAHQWVGRDAPEGLDEYELPALTEELSTESNQAPLAWSMLQRALRTSEDRRVSLVLAVAAAEIAVKHCLVELDKSTLAGWILIDEQSPAWPKLVNEGLGRLTDKRTNEQEPRVLPLTITRPIRRGFELRNAFVHRGEILIDYYEFEKLIVAVNDLLYALEWIRGEEWAFAHMSKDAQSAWA